MNSQANWNGPSSNRPADPETRKACLISAIQATVKTPWNDKTAPKIERKPDFMRVPESYLGAIVLLALVRPRSVPVVPVPKLRRMVKKLGCPATAADGLTVCPGRPTKLRTPPQFSFSWHQGGTLVTHPLPVNSCTRCQL
jgi:hypothetical protein